MRLTLDLPDELLERLAELVAARLGATRREADAEQLVGWREAGVSARTWRRAIRAGELPAVRVGRELRACRADVSAWLERQRVKVAAPAAPEPAQAKADVDDELEGLLASGRLRVVRGGGAR